MPSVILNFHGIGRPGRALEPGEDRFWIAADAFRRILDRVAAAPGPWPLRLTFDDGNASDIAVAAPELAARGLTATFFPVAGRIGAPGSLAAADIRALAAAGHGIGSHGQDHVDWRRLRPDQEPREYDHARDAIGAVTGVPPDTVAIPFGYYHARVLAALARRPYARVYTCDKGLADEAAWLQPRTCIEARMDSDEIAALIDGRAPPLRRLRRGLGVLWKRHVA